MMKGIDLAKQYLGVEEVRDRAKLIKLFKKFAINNDIVVDPSTTPWCACFVNACERAVGNKGTGKQNARSFLDYGTKVELRDVQEGDILIFTRGNSTWQGHVTYYAGMGPNGMLVCLGGNQSNQVCEQFYPASRLLGIRRS